VQQVWQLCRKAALCYEQLCKAFQTFAGMELACKAKSMGTVAAVCG